MIASATPNAPTSRPKISAHVGPHVFIQNRNAKIHASTKPRTSNHQNAPQQPDRETATNAAAKAEYQPIRSQSHSPGQVQPLKKGIKHRR